MDISVLSYQSASCVQYLLGQNVFKAVPPPSCCLLIDHIKNKEYFPFVYNFIFTI